MAAEFRNYEYKTVTVKSNALSLWLDGYESFGWQEDPRFPDRGEKETVVLRLRRDRRILNKMELTRLQRNFEACMEEIDALEKAPDNTALGAALAVGLVGTALLAGSVFSVAATPPIIWLCVLLGVPGLIGWVLPYFVYQHVRRKRARSLAPLIEKKQDEIWTLMEKGQALL